MEKNESNNKIKNNKKTIGMIIFWVLILLIFLAIGIWYVQPSAFFYPWHDKQSYEYLQTNNEFEELKIQNGENVISGWIKYNKPKEEKSPLIIMFGGNAQNSSNTCKWFYNDEIFKIFEGYNFIVIDYPTYGLSTGKLSEKTMFDTGIKTYEYALGLDSVDENNIIVLGFSIGTGVANYVASEKNPNGLILVAPYDRALSLYNNVINVFHGPMKLLTRYKFDSISYAEKMDVIKPLLITSTDDEVISYKQAENLSKHYKSTPKYLCINGAKHNDYFLREEVLVEIESYLKEKLNKID